MVNSTGVATTFEGEYYALAICWLLGNGCLLALSSMFTFVDYYNDLFPEYHPSRILPLIYLSIATGTLGVLAHNEGKINTRLRNLLGYNLFSISFLAIIVLDIVTYGRGGIGPFIGVCVISAVFGLADAHVQGGLIGDPFMMTPDLILSFLAGLASSGTLTSGLRLITKAAFEDSRDGLRKGALLFFAISALIEFVCVLLYACVFPKLPIVKYYRARAAVHGSKTVTADLAAGGLRELPFTMVRDMPILFQHTCNELLLFMNQVYAINLFLLYLLTLGMFPAFLSVNTGEHSLGDWYGLVLITIFNLSDLVGRYIPVVRKLKLESKTGLKIVSMGRFLLIPAFYFAPKYGNQDWMILVLTSFLGLTNGYMTVCILTANLVDYLPTEQNALGNLLVLFLSGGKFAGIIFGWLWLIGKG